MRAMAASVIGVRARPVGAEGDQVAMALPGREQLAQARGAAARCSAPVTAGMTRETLCSDVDRREAPGRGEPPIQHDVSVEDPADLVGDGLLHVAARRPGPCRWR